jgi:hypothetical protein
VQPRTTPRVKPSSVQPTTTQQGAQPSGIDMLKKVLNQEEDKSYLKTTQWHPGTGKTCGIP